MKNRYERLIARLTWFINHPVMNVVIALLILISVILLFIEHLSSNPQTVHFLMTIDTGIVTLFIIELTIRLLCEKKKANFFKNYWVDLISILPILRPLRFLRVLRLLRLFRMGSILSRHLNSVTSVFRHASHEYSIILILIIMVIFIGAFGISITERNNPEFPTFGKAIWWSVLSMVGSQPILGNPQTQQGYAITLIVMLGGATIFAMFVGLFSAIMTEKLKNRMELKDMDIEYLKDHIIICGWNRQAPMIIEAFQVDPEYKDTCIVAIAEFEEEPKLDLARVNPGRVFFIKADHTKIDILMRARVEAAKIAIILADKTLPRSDQDRDARSVLTALIIEKLNKNIFTCVELLNRQNEMHLKMIGVEEIYVGDEYGSSIISLASKKQGIINLLNELLSSQYQNQFYKQEIPEFWIGHAVKEIHSQMKERYNATLVSIERDKEADQECQPSHAKRVTIINPPLDFILNKGDTVIYISDTLKKFTEK